MNPALKYLWHRFAERSDRWRPFLAVHYLTYQCDFRCPYCSNGFATPYHQLHQQILPASEFLQVLGRIRRHCDYVVLTGGEPLQHPQFAEILAGARCLRFRDLALNTNGYDLERFLPQIAASVDTLIVSLDTLESSKADAWLGRVGAFDRIRGNLLAASRIQPRRYRIVISSVATAENLPDLYAVYAFAREHGFTFAVAPELQGVKPPAALRENRAYQAFFDFLIAEKRGGAAIYGSPLYLEHMRDFRQFRCHPFTLLVVDPLGAVFYPCLELGHLAGNLLGEDDLHALRRRGEAQFGPPPECDSRCHSACALGLSLILEQPRSLGEEAVCLLKGWLSGRNRPLAREWQ
jgi:MoaA/NifB/PqqE/SkfB family radical SAM enzyme